MGPYGLRGHKRLLRRPAVALQIADFLSNSNSALPGHKCHQLIIAEADKLAGHAPVSGAPQQLLRCRRRPQQHQHLPSWWSKPLLASWPCSSATTDTMRICPSWRQQSATCWQRAIRRATGHSSAAWPTCSCWWTSITAVRACGSLWWSLGSALQASASLAPGAQPEKQLLFKADCKQHQR